MDSTHLLSYRKPFWLAIAVLMLALGGMYVLIIRPYHLRWGATDQELALVLPGDATIPADGPISTRDHDPRTGRDRVGLAGTDRAESWWRLAQL